MRRLLLFVGPLLFAVSCVSFALAQDTVAPSMPSVPPGADGFRYMLGLGPYGIVLWFGWLMAKGFNVTLTHRVTLSDEDRQLATRITKALEKKVSG